jgi:peptide/nickel transport system permease protein
MVISLAVVMVPYISRVVRTATLSEKGMEYVMAARASGAGLYATLIHEVLPNVVPHTLAYSTTLVRISMVVGAGLSFLGLGVQRPAADWGLMVAEGQNVLREAPHVSIIPGLVIVAVALAFNLLGDGIRDLLDPRLRV